MRARCVLDHAAQMARMLVRRASPPGDGSGVGRRTWRWLSRLWACRV